MGTAPPEVAAEDRATWRSLGLNFKWHEQLHALIVTGDVAFVLVDTNSDGREIELDIHRRTPDGDWALVYEMDDVGDPGMAPVEQPGFAYGRSQAATVTISYRDAQHEVRVNSLGWWAFFDLPNTWDVPIRVD
jgi:hypothetical protein